MKAVSLGGHGYLEESTAKRVYNSFATLLNDKIGSDSPHQAKTLTIDPKKEALAFTQAALRKGQMAQAHHQLERLSNLLDTATDSDESFEQKVKELKFAIETHEFAWQFNAKLIDQLRGDYVEYLVKGGEEAQR